MTELNLSGRVYDTLQRLVTNRTVNPKDAQELKDVIAEDGRVDADEQKLLDNLSQGNNQVIIVSSRGRTGELNLNSLNFIDDARDSLTATIPVPSPPTAPLVYPQFAQQVAQTTGVYPQLAAQLEQVVNTANANQKIDSVPKLVNALADYKKQLADLRQTIQKQQDILPGQSAELTQLQGELMQADLQLGQLLVKAASTINTESFYLPTYNLGPRRKLMAMAQQSLSTLPTANAQLASRWQNNQDPQLRQQLLTESKHLQTSATHLGATRDAFEIKVAQQQRSSGERQAIVARLTHSINQVSANPVVLKWEVAGLPKETNVSARDLFALLLEPLSVTLDFAGNRPPDTVALAALKTLQADIVAAYDQEIPKMKAKGGSAKTLVGGMTALRDWVAGLDFSKTAQVKDFQELVAPKTQEARQKALQKIQNSRWVAEKEKSALETLVQATDKAVTFDPVLVKQLGAWQNSVVDLELDLQDAQPEFLNLSNQLLEKGSSQVIQTGTLGAQAKARIETLTQRISQVRQGLEQSLQDAQGLTTKPGTQTDIDRHQKVVAVLKLFEKRAAMIGNGATPSTVALLDKQIAVALKQKDFPLFKGVDSLAHPLERLATDLQRLDALYHLQLPDGTARIVDTYPDQDLAIEAARQQVKGKADRMLGVIETGDASHKQYRLVQYPMAQWAEKSLEAREKTADSSLVYVVAGNKHDPAGFKEDFKDSQFHFRTEGAQGAGNADPVVHLQEAVQRWQKNAEKSIFMSVTERGHHLDTLAGDRKTIEKAIERLADQVEQDPTLDQTSRNGLRKALGELWAWAGSDQYGVITGIYPTDQVWGAVLKRNMALQEIFVGIPDTVPLKATLQEMSLAISPTMILKPQAVNLFNQVIATIAHSPTAQDEVRTQVTQLAHDYPGQAIVAVDLGWVNEANGGRSHRGYNVVQVPHPPADINTLTKAFPSIVMTAQYDKGIETTSGKLNKPPVNDKGPNDVALKAFAPGKLDSKVLRDSTTRQEVIKAIAENVREQLWHRYDQALAQMQAWQKMPPEKRLLELLVRTEGQTAHQHADTPDAEIGKQFLETLRDGLHVLPHGTTFSDIAELGRQVKNARRFLRRQPPEVEPALQALSGSQAANLGSLLSEGIAESRAGLKAAKAKSQDIDDIEVIMLGMKEFPSLRQSLYQSLNFRHDPAQGVPPFKRERLDQLLDYVKTHPDQGTFASNAEMIFADSTADWQQQKEQTEFAKSVLTVAATLALPVLPGVVAVGLTAYFTAKGFVDASEAYQHIDVATGNVAADLWNPDTIDHARKQADDALRSAVIQTVSMPLSVGSAFYLTSKGASAAVKFATDLGLNVATTTVEAGVNDANMKTYLTNLAISGAMSFASLGINKVSEHLKPAFKTSGPQISEVEMALIDERLFVRTEAGHLQEVRAIPQKTGTYFEYVGTVGPNGESVGFRVAGQRQAEIRGQVRTTGALPGVEGPAHTKAMPNVDGATSAKSTGHYSEISPLKPSYQPGLDPKQLLHQFSADEVAKTYLITERKVKVEHILDLTDPQVQAYFAKEHPELTYQMDDLLRRSDPNSKSKPYDMPQALGDWAKKHDYNGVKVPSATEAGSENIVFFYDIDDIDLVTGQSFSSANPQATVPQGTKMPPSLTYEGDIYRFSASKYMKNQPEVSGKGPIGPEVEAGFRIDAKSNSRQNHRYTGGTNVDTDLNTPRRLGLYTSTSLEANLGELRHYGLDYVVMLEPNVTKGHILDLKDPKIREKWHISLEDLTHDGHIQKIEALAEKARAAGYNGLRIPGKG